MAFTVGQRVWFKRAGSTPFVTGVAAAAATVYDSALGGRGDPSITLSGSSLGIQGVPQYNAAFQTKVNTGVENTEHTVSGTIVAAGQNLGVREAAQTNPYVVGTVSTDGVYDGPTPPKLFGNQDEAEIAGTNSQRTIDPNFPTGRPSAVTATGTTIPLSGSHEFANETINVAGTTVGYRTPSSEEGAGVVVQVVTSTANTYSPDGTKIIAGSQYWVNWGASCVSNPARGKWNNRFRVMIHTEEDLVAA
jgi:hypothetical protein